MEPIHKFKYQINYTHRPWNDKKSSTQVQLSSVVLENATDIRYIREVDSEISQRSKIELFVKANYVI